MCGLISLVEDRLSCPPHSSFHLKSADANIHNIYYTGVKLKFDLQYSNIFVFAYEANTKSLFELLVCNYYTVQVNSIC